jgi:hypothetical protein
MACATAIAGYWASSQYGELGWSAALVASAVCSGAALIALAISAALAGSPHALAANLGVMLVRMGAPLAGLMVLPGLLPQLADAGFGHCVLGLYLVGLAAETLLAMRHSQAANSKSASMRSVASSPAMEAK